MPPACTLLPVRDGRRLRLLEGVCTPSLHSSCRHMHRPFMRHELARFSHERTRHGLPPRTGRRDIQ